MGNISYIFWESPIISFMILQLLSTQLVDSQFFQNITPCIDNFSLKKGFKVWYRNKSGQHLRSLWYLQCYRWAMGPLATSFLCARVIHLHVIFRLKYSIYLVVFASMQFKHHLTQLKFKHCKLWNFYFKR